MMWKAIGQSVTGTSHTATGKPCEDSVAYAIIPAHDGTEVLACCVSDGAGSARYAAWASAYVTHAVLEHARRLATYNEELDESRIYALCEDLYDNLQLEAERNEVPLNEYSCTLLGCIALHNRTAWFQVGDGALIHDDGAGGYATQWWPHNGEYQNTTSFLIDDQSMGHLEIVIVDEPVQEVAIFTDGLQMLTLNMESRSVHQPFFTDLFRYLRMADNEEKLTVLNSKLAAYLDGPAINQRTDDDKTLFLATRLPA